MDREKDKMGQQMQKQRILFVCTGNSCRSQMAEGWLRHEAEDRFEVFSAGTHPTSVHPLAIQVMAEQGVDLSSHRSKSVDEVLDQAFDYVITVCGGAKEECPFFPGSTQRLHWDIDDPVRAVGTPEEVLEVFRTVRNEVRGHIQRFIEETDSFTGE
jgi:arsenate reductase